MRWETADMTGSDPKADLHHYLQQARDALLWKLDGLSEYDIRRPLVPTATNLLGLVKHLTGVEFVYFGTTFGRPSADELPWSGDDPMSDMSRPPASPVRRSPVCIRRRGRTRIPPSRPCRLTRPAACRTGLASTAR
jgi:hypothetical protein